jgi:hypothetical protein
VTFALWTETGRFALQLTRGLRLSDRAFETAGEREPGLRGHRPPFGSGDWVPRCYAEVPEGFVPRLVGFTFAHASYHYCDRLETS